MVFDLEALADIEGAGHRPAFNAAFAELGLDIEWSVARYRQLQALCDERRRVAAELRKRGVSSECDVLAELLVDEICAAKAMILDETILDSDVVTRLGLVELITEAFGAGIAVGIVSSSEGGEPLVRQLVGEGVVRRRHGRRRQEAHAGFRGLPNRTVGTRDTRGECARGHWVRPRGCAPRPPRWSRYCGHHR